MIKALAGTQINPVVLVDDQDVQDIMRGLKMKHKQCTADYDRIAKYFPSDDVEELCYDLWAFCRDNLTYFEEPVKKQEVRSPITILKSGYSDCKCYSLFIAGILDAKRRKGLDIDWVFRFTPTVFYKADIGHVFVVVNPKSDNIWVDAVLDTFDQHNIYFVKVDEKVNTYAQLGRVGGLTVLPRGRIGSAEDTLLAAVKEYSDGLDNAIEITQSSGLLNTITAGVLATASAAIPGLGAALGVMKVAAVAANDVFGVGSKAAILINDYASNPLTAEVKIVESLFNGRTYNTDQYYAAMYYQFYVLGKNVTNIDKIADSDVMPALKWFIDRTNVFISGQEHLRALGQSAAKYVSYFGVNADTTTDMTRVVPAVAVASQYWIFNGVLGSWANTVGVFDPELVQYANAMGESPEQAQLQVDAGTLVLPDQSGSSLPAIFSNPIVWVIGGGILTALLFTGKTKK